MTKQKDSSPSQSLEEDNHYGSNNCSSNIFLVSAGYLKLERDGKVCIDVLLLRNAKPEL